MPERYNVPPGSSPANEARSAHIAKIENLMRIAGETVRENNASPYRSPETDRQARKTMQNAAEAGMQARRDREPRPKAEGGVIAPSTRWGNLYGFLFGKGALDKAAGTSAPPPAAAPQSDISYVRKAAEEAGKRNEEAAKPTPARTPKYGGYKK